MFVRKGFGLKIFFGFALLFAGFYVAIVFGLSNIYKAQCAEEWPVVQGRITASGLAGRTFKFGRQKPVEIAFAPDIKYEYTIDGTSYESDVVYPGSKYYILTRDKASDVVRRYVWHQRVEVRYNPGRHGDSMLEFGDKKEFRVILWTGLGAVVAGFFMLLGQMFDLSQK